MSGMELFERLTTEKNELLVTFVGGHVDAPVAVQGIKAGAIDFLTKPVSSENLVALVARAYAMYYDVDCDFVREDLDDIESSFNRLTGREKEILDLIADGLSSLDIGASLGICAKTVEAYRFAIIEKMRADELRYLVQMPMASRDMQAE